ncbi:MAG: hypothetical protein K2P94_08150 [Rhodospirillaceae bacterium]|nr:hypothetical protein [Rhodospirillaceae bacterium]
MKDQDNNRLVLVEESLQRLDRALVRLETAALVVRERTAETAENLNLQATEAATTAMLLEEKLGTLSRAHADLKATSGRVAGRLDAVIGRLSTALQE